VTVSTQIVKQLEDRGWIEAIGYRETPGRPALYATTRQFLDDLGLASLAQLPELSAASLPASLLPAEGAAGTAPAAAADALDLQDLPLLAALLDGAAPAEALPPSEPEELPSPGPSPAPGATDATPAFTLSVEVDSDASRSH